MRSHAVISPRKVPSLQLGQESREALPSPSRCIGFSESKGGPGVLGFPSPGRCLLDLVTQASKSYLRSPLPFKILSSEDGVGLEGPGGEVGGGLELKSPEVSGQRQLLGRAGECLAGTATQGAEAVWREVTSVPEKTSLLL